MSVFHLQILSVLQQNYLEMMTELIVEMIVDERIVEVVFVWHLDQWIRFVPFHVFQ
jgi:hypothetical protein